MDIVKKEIRQYQTTDGQFPFRTWFNSLRDTTIQNRIRARLMRVKAGHFGDHKYVGQGVLELRLHFGPGYRIYYGEQENTIVLLLCAGDKNSQQKDIQKAVLYWNDFKRRENYESEPVL